MNTNILRPAFATAVISLVMAAVACDARAESTTHTTTATPTPQWNVMQEYHPTATPTLSVPDVQPTPAPTEDPAGDSVPAEAPRVLWLRTSHAGPGVVTVRFATNVPTTATVMAMTNQIGPAHFYSEDLTTLSTEHATSVPASAFGRYQVRIEDEAGDVARAELRYESDLQGIDWATGAAAPALTAPNAKQLDVSYAFPANHPSKLGFDGSVHVFMTDADCTTADACQGELVGSALAAPATMNGQLEAHKAIASIPGPAFDYQVVVGQPLNDAQSMMIFLQLGIRGDELPGVNLGGPKVIKN